MKPSARTARPPVPGGRADILHVTVSDQKLLMLHRLVQRRKRITRKIQRLPDLAARLKIEAPDLSIQELLARLNKSKAGLDQAIAKHGTASRSTKTPRGLPKSRSMRFTKERALMTIDEVLAAQAHQVAFGPSDLLDQTTCPTIEGRAMPFLTQVGATVPALNDLNHDSSADYTVEDVSYFTGSLGYLIGAWLNDDASMWRDDNPDSIMWYDGICLYLPRVVCDSEVMASISVRFSGEISSEADDHNEVRQYVYIAHSDEDGNLPPSVSFGDEYDVNTLDLSGEIGLPYGNRFDSGWINASMAFRVKAGVASRVAMSNCTELRAQDGVLGIIGTWEITDLCYSARAA